MKLIVTTAFFGLLAVSLAVILAVAGLLVVQRLVPLSTRESHNAAIGIIYAALYVMFGMVVGFSAYLVLSKYNTSQNTAKSEASNVENFTGWPNNYPNLSGARSRSSPCLTRESWWTRSGLL